MDRAGRAAGSRAPMYRRRELPARRFLSPCVAPHRTHLGTDPLPPPMRSIVPALLAALLLPACQSMSAGVLALEGRAIVIDDASLDESDLGSAFQEEDVDVTGYGAQLALMTPIVDLLAAVDKRDYEDADSTELSLGARRRVLEIWRFHPYVEGNLRYAIDLDTGDVGDDYFGWNLGAGTLFDLTDTLFLNVRVMYETLSIDLPANSGVDLDGIVATVGLGVAF